MTNDRIVQFVCFDTALDSEEFVIKWEEYSRSVNSDRDVTLQQSRTEKGFRYIAQHNCVAGELQFIFEKARRSSRIHEAAITAKLAGGYILLQAARIHNSPKKDESKVFAFIPDIPVNLENYRKLSVNSDLNIYEAYYENCRYRYILEFFVRNEFASGLMGLLAQYETADRGIYKECIMHAL